ARGRPRELLPELPPAAPMRVEWPSEEERRILALRLVAPQTERFPGRSLRQALAAEGFLLGQFAIFHKPDDELRGRVLGGRRGRACLTWRRGTRGTTAGCRCLLCCPARSLRRRRSMSWCSPHAISTTACTGCCRTSTARPSLPLASRSCASSCTRERRDRRSG